MMNVWQAQYQFWAGFGIPAFEERVSIDDEYESYPYLTYEAVNGIMGQVASIYVSLWYRSESMEEISLKADEIGEAVGMATTIPFDGGIIILRKPETTPFARPIASGLDDKQVKRMNLILEIEVIK